MLKHLDIPAIRERRRDQVEVFPITDFRWTRTGPTPIVTVSAPSHESRGVPGLGPGPGDFGAAAIRHATAKGHGRRGQESDDAGERGAAIAIGANAGVRKLRDDRVVRDTGVNDLAGLR